MKNIKLVPLLKYKLYELTLGYACNCNCRFCSISSSFKKINKTTSEAIADIYQASKQGFNLLGFGGGEPTIRDDIIKLVKFSKGLGFEIIRIQTNGVMLGYEDFCKRMLDAGATFFKISVHGHNAKIHDYLTRKRGSFDLVLKGIDNLHKLDMRIEANIVLNKINYKFLPQYINFFMDRGVSSFCIVFPMYTGNMYENRKEIGIKVSEAISYIREAMEMINSLGLDKGIVMNTPLCYMKGYEDEVVEEYNMKLIAPNMVIDDADENVKSEKVKLAECKGCRSTYRCNGVWKKYISIYGDGEFKRLKKDNDKKN